MSCLSKRLFLDKETIECLKPSHIYDTVKDNDLDYTDWVWVNSQVKFLPPTKQELIDNLEDFYN